MANKSSLQIEIDKIRKKLGANAEIWTGNKAPDGSPIFADQTCYALVANDNYHFIVFDNADIEGLSPEDYDWTKLQVAPAH